MTIAEFEGLAIPNEQPIHTIPNSNPNPFTIEEKLIHIFINKSNRDLLIIDNQRVILSKELLFLEQKLGVNGLV